MQTNIEILTKGILHEITFIIGLIGIVIIIIGSIDGLTQFILHGRKSFAKVRYIIGKHILLGLDFLVVKDIIETVLLKGSEVHVMDLLLLITIVGIRIALTSHTAKGVQEMKTEMERAKRKRQEMDMEINDLEREEEEIEKEICNLKANDMRAEEKRRELEEKIKNLQKLLKEKTKK